MTRTSDDLNISDSDINPFEKKTQTKTQTKPRKVQGPLPPWKEGAIAQFARQSYEMIGNLAKVGDPVCGEALITIAEPAGKAWEKLAKQHNATRRLFAYLMQGSVVAEIITAHIPLGGAILMHHGPFKKATEQMADMLTEEFANVVQEMKTENV